MAELAKHKDIIMSFPIDTFEFAVLQTDSGPMAYLTVNKDMAEVIVRDLSTLLQNFKSKDKTNE